MSMSRPIPPPALTADEWMRAVERQYNQPMQAPKPPVPRHPHPRYASQYWGERVIPNAILAPCACPAPHPPSARFCPRCGGTIRTKGFDWTGPVIILVGLLPAYVGLCYLLNKALKHFP